MAAKTVTGTLADAGGARGCYSRNVGKQASSGREPMGWVSRLSLLGVGVEERVNGGRLRYDILGDYGERCKALVRRCVDTIDADGNRRE